MRESGKARLDTRVRQCLDRVRRGFVGREGENIAGEKVGRTPTPETNGAEGGGAGYGAKRLPTPGI